VSQRERDVFDFVDHPFLCCIFEWLLRDQELPSFMFLNPHTHEPKDVPRCGALSLLQKPLHSELVNTGRFFENTQNTVRMLAHAK
jgi:hypothetical protein